MPSEGLEPSTPSLPSTHGNGFRLFEPFSPPRRLPPVATGCDRWAPQRLLPPLSSLTTTYEGFPASYFAIGRSRREGRPSGCTACVPMTRVSLSSTVAGALPGSVLSGLRAWVEPDRIADPPWADAAQATRQGRSRHRFQTSTPATNPACSSTPVPDELMDPAAREMRPDERKGR
jgi:hypothetical protein